MAGTATGAGAVPGTRQAALAGPVATPRAHDLVPVDVVAVHATVDVAPVDVVPADVVPVDATVVGVRAAGGMRTGAERIDRRKNGRISRRSRWSTMT